MADPSETVEDLVRDMLTGMRAGLYGRRGAGNRAMHAPTAAKRDPGEAA
jgi:predicted site-specific integrase-resolvase